MGILVFFEWTSGFTTLYQSSSSDSSEGTSSSNEVTVTGCSSYSTLLVFVSQGVSYSSGDANSMYSKPWTVTGGSYNILYPSVSKTGKYMAVLKITPTSDTVTMYCSAGTGTNGYRKFYVIGV